MNGFSEGAQEAVAELDELGGEPVEIVGELERELIFLLFLGGISQVLGACFGAETVKGGLERIRGGGERFETGEGAGAGGGRDGADAGGFGVGGVCGELAELWNWGEGVNRAVERTW